MALKQQSALMICDGCDRVIDESKWEYRLMLVDNRTGEHLHLHDYDCLKAWADATKVKHDKLIQKAKAANASKDI